MEPKCIIPLNKAIFRLLRFFSLFKRYKHPFGIIQIPMAAPLFPFLVKHQLTNVNSTAK